MFFARDVSLVRRLLYAAVDPFFYLPANRIASAVAPPAGQRPQRPAVPTLAIVTPSLNQSEFLARAIESVVSQAYPSLEYVVQDGGSTDGSVSIIESHAAQLTSWESRRDAGQSAAINAGFRRTTGEIMMFLNSDDVLMPGALSYIGNYFASHPDVDVVYSHSLLIDRHDRPIALRLLPGHNGRALRCYNYVPQETCAWRRRVWDAAGGMLDESLQYAMDWDLFRRFLDVNARFVRLPTILAAFRHHSDQKTQRARATVVEEGAILHRRRAQRTVSFLETAIGAAPHVAARMSIASAYRLGLRHVELPYARHDDDPLPDRMTVINAPVTNLAASPDGRHSRS